jgi:predicted nuclease with TOPRIM domain
MIVGLRFELEEMEGRRGERDAEFENLAAERATLADELRSAEDKVLSLQVRIHGCWPWPFDGPLPLGI